MKTTIERCIEAFKLYVNYVKYEVTGLYEIAVIKTGSLILKYRNYGSTKRKSILEIKKQTRS